MRLPSHKKRSVGAGQDRIANLEKSIVDEKRAIDQLASDHKQRLAKIRDDQRDDSTQRQLDRRNAYAEYHLEVGELLRSISFMESEHLLAHLEVLEAPFPSNRLEPDLWVDDDDHGYPPYLSEKGKFHAKTMVRSLKREEDLAAANRRSYTIACLAVVATILAAGTSPVIEKLLDAQWSEQPEQERK